ncbi:MAG: PASTA domain-containing protein [Candidatus Omnitrophota bacterium]
MKKDYGYFAKILGLAALYFLIFFFSVFFTMQALIKGEELNAPDLIGKSVSEAEQIAEKNRIYIKKIAGNYEGSYKPNVVINQVPSAGVRIKEKSIIKVFVPSEVVEMVVPNLAGLTLNESEKLLKENGLIKRYVSYIDSDDVPADIVIGQSYPVGAEVSGATGIDLLASRGSKEKSYIMPDLIGKKSSEIVSELEQMGLNVSSPTHISYPGVGSGIIVKQYPLSGYPITNKARISIEVSK